MSFQKCGSTKRFPSIKLINKVFEFIRTYLTPTIVNASNEVLVNLFLAKGKIGFLDIVKTINRDF